MPPRQRWPLHPIPHPGEGIDSWLARIANAIGVRVSDLLDDLCGRQFGAEEMLLHPPATFIESLASRTGTTEERVLSMTLSKLAPNVFARCPLPAHAFEIYLDRRRLIALAGAQGMPPPTYWIPWINYHVFHDPFVCHRCKDDYLGGGTLLQRTVMMVTCPRHHTLLNRPRSHWSEKYPIELSPVFIRDYHRRMDELTAHCFEHGSLTFRGQVLTFMAWARFLRQILEELTYPYRAFGRMQERMVRSIWREVGVRPHNTMRQRFEKVRSPQRFRYLEATAFAVHLIEKGELSIADDALADLDHIP
jgi:hypothetical protein